MEKDYNELYHAAREVARRGLCRYIAHSVIQQVGGATLDNDRMREKPRDFAAQGFPHQRIDAKVLREVPFCVFLWKSRRNLEEVRLYQCDARGLQK